MMTKRPSTRQAFVAALISGAALFGYYALESLQGLVLSISGEPRGITPQVSPYDAMGGIGAIGYIRQHKEISNETPSDDARHVPALPDRPSELHQSGSGK